MIDDFDNHDTQSVIEFDSCEAAKKISEGCLTWDYLLFENMILIDNRNLESVVTTADSKSYSHYFYPNWCQVPIFLSPKQKILSKIVSLISSFVPLPNRIANYCYLHFSCELISIDPDGTKIYLNRCNSIWLYIYHCNDMYIVNECVGKNLDYWDSYCKELSEKI